jgi:hypothetical protein
MPSRNIDSRSSFELANQDSIPSNFRLLVPGCLMPVSTPPAPKRFVLYLPKAASEAVPGLIPAMELLFCRRFGGLTTYPAVGLYQSEGGEIQREEVFVMECYGELEGWMEDGPRLHHLAAVLAVILEQETIACSVDGRMHRIKPLAAAKVVLPSEDPAKIADHLMALSSDPGRRLASPW